MNRLACLLARLLTLAHAGAWAWSKHTLPSYRAFETMPEVAQAAPVKAEALEAFLKAQERPSADLRGNADPTRALPHNALNFLPEQAKDERRFVRTDAGEAVAPLAVQAMRFPQASD